MKFLFTADWHLSKYGHDKNREETSLPERLHGIKSTMYQMGEYCVSHGIEFMVIGGDLNHTKTVIYSIVLDILTQFIRDYKDRIEFIIIDGNHDLSGKGTNVVSALKGLDSEPNVHRIRGEKAEFYRDRNNDILYVPYSHNMIKHIKENEAEYLISHFGLNEAILSSGISIVSDIGLKDLSSNYHTVLLGHYHLPQEIIRGDIKLYYSGSTTQLDWGEKHEEKRFLVVDTDTRVIESVPTSGYKKYFEYEVTEENLREMIQEAQEMKGLGHFVQLKKIEKVNTDDIPDDIRIIDRTEQDITNRGVTSSMTTMEKFERYLEIKEIPENERADYREMFKKLVDSCSEETL